MNTLAPCSAKDKSVSLLSLLLRLPLCYLCFSLTSTAFVNCICHCAACYALLTLPPNFAPIYGITLSDRRCALSSPHRCLLKSRLVALAECDEGFQAGPHDYPATSFECTSPTTLSWELIGCNLSQWESNSHWGRWMWQERMLGISSSCKATEIKKVLLKIHVHNV